MFSSLRKKIQAPSHVLEAGFCHGNAEKEKLIRCRAALRLFQIAGECPFLDFARKSEPVHAPVKLSVCIFPTSNLQPLNLRWYPQQRILATLLTPR
jgi:hypothetical protein